MAPTDSAKHPSLAMGESRTQRTLPDFLQSVNLKYVKLGYHYLITHAVKLLLIPLLISIGIELLRLQPSDLVSRWEQLHVDLLTLLACSVGLVLGITVYLMSRKPSVYLVDFSCYLPPDELKAPSSQYRRLTSQYGCFTEESHSFQLKILERSGLGDETYLPPALHTVPPNTTLAMAHKEAEMAIFGAIDELFARAKVNPKDVGILVVNCSLFSPTPSLSAMVVNKYGMRSNIRSFNLGGMGCSAGLIAVDLAKDMLQVHGGSLAVVVSTENQTQNAYFGNQRSMLITNCIFRTGCAAVLLSSRSKDSWRAKYKLVHTVRTHMGSDPLSYGCVVQEEDSEGKRGISLSKDLMTVAGNSLKTNITTLGPLVLPFSEQLLFLAVLVARKLLGIRKMKLYIPDFKLAFEHFCIHSGGRAVLDELEKNLQLTPWHMEPSRMTLYRFGNISSSSIWYELAYSEAKGRVHKGDRVWQIAFGSGFKCNSAVWCALRSIDAKKSVGPWRGSIQNMPADLSHLP